MRHMRRRARWRSKCISSDARPWSHLDEGHGGARQLFIPQPHPIIFDTTRTTGIKLLGERPYNFSGNVQEEDRPDECERENEDHIGITGCTHSIWHPPRQ